MKRHTLVVLLLVAAAALSATGCIAFVDRGVRGGQLTSLSPTIEKGDKREEVLKILGDPDEIVRVGDAEHLTYRAVRGFYIVLFGKFEYYRLRLEIQKDVVTSVHAAKTGEDLLIFTGLAGGLPEPGTP